MLKTEELVQKLTRLLSLSDEDRDIDTLAADVADALCALFDATFTGVFRRQPFTDGLTLVAASRSSHENTSDQETCITLANNFEAGRIATQESLVHSQIAAFDGRALFLSWVAKAPFVPQSPNAFSAVVLRQEISEAEILATIPLLETWLSTLFSRCLARSRHDRRIEFLRHLTEIPSSDIDRVFSTLLESFTQAVPCRFIDLWLYNDIDDTLVIRSFAPATVGGVSVSFSDFDSQVLRRTDSLTGIVVETKRPTIFPELIPPFRNPLFAERLGLKWLLSLPLSDTVAGNHLGILNIWPEGPPEDFDQDMLELLTAYVAPVPAAVRLSYLLFQESLVAAYDSLFERMLVFSDQEDWWNDLARLVRDHMRCEGCSVFLRGKDDRLYLRGTTGLEQPKKPDAVFYDPGQGLTGTTFATGRPQIYHVELADEFRAIHLSRHRENTTGKSKSILLVPIIGAAGRVDGVLRCNNKKEVPARQVGRFTREDLAHLRQIAKLISNLHSRALWLRAREEERSRAITSLGHELKAPVSTFMRHAEWLTRFAPESMTGEQGARLRLKLDDIHRNSELLSLLVSNIADIDEIVLDPSEVHVIKLVERCLSCVYDEARAARINFYTGEIAIRRFFCDELQMMRVLFNLVRNAVKYHDRKEKVRFVSVGAREERNRWVVVIRDNGIGIPAGEEEEVFAQFKRGSNAASVYPQGTGLGLYFCKRIAEAHGGGIRLAKYSKPTEFQVYWPTR